MHHDYVWRDGVVLPETVPCARDLRELDERCHKGINLGSAGDSVAPEKPIIIGGSGLQLLGTGASIEGGITTLRGGRVGLGDNDWPKGCPTTKSVLVPIVGARQAVGTGNAFVLEESFDPVGTKVLESLNGFSAPIIFLIPQRYLHHGARLSTVVLSFRIGQSHAAVPGTNTPGLIVTRLNQGSTVGANLSTVPAVLTAPGTGALYYAGGAEQTVTLTNTQNHDIDVGTYKYGVQIFDEAGTGSLPGNIFHSVKLNFTSIADLRFE